MEQKYTISTSPHIKSKETISRIMWTVVIALIPAGVAGITVFGIDALWVILTCIVAAVITEAIIQKLSGRKVTVADGSAVLTGLLLAYVLPPNIPLYVAAVGSIVAIAVAKHAFGGLGNNIWNPALIGRAFIVAGWASFSVLSSWPMVQTESISQAPTVSITTEMEAGRAYDEEKSPAGQPTKYVVVSKATPLNIAQKQGVQKAVEKYENPNAPFLSKYYDIAVGRIPGCIGETSAIVLMLGGLLLIFFGYVNWRMPLGFILTVALLTWILPAEVYNGTAGTKGSSWFSGYPLFHILSGGLFLGAFFMATDMVTTPLSNLGIWIFAIGAGFIVAMIRLYSGGYPEGVCYSILIMNTVTPLIDRFTRPRVFGTGKTS